MVREVSRHNMLGICGALFLIGSLVILGCRGNEASSTPEPTAPAALATTTPGPRPSAGFFGLLPAARTGTCPEGRDWPLLYWRGNEIAIAQASGVCEKADRFWVRRGADWLGYAIGVPDFAVDDYRLSPGEAVFVRGGN